MAVFYYKVLGCIGFSALTTKKGGCQRDFGEEFQGQPHRLPLVG